MTLTEWAESQGIHPQTAYRWFRAGKMPVPAERVGGLIMVGDLSGDEPPLTGSTVISARVSSADQKTDLDRQVARVTTWGLLRDPTVTTIIVEHRDRCARFGAEYVAGALDAGHRRMVIVDGGEVDDDLVRDMTELMTSLCARLYGRRSAAHRATKAVEVATSGAGSGGGHDD